MWYDQNWCWLRHMAVSICSSKTSISVIRICLWFVCGRHYCFSLSYVLFNSFIDKNWFFITLAHFICPEGVSGIWHLAQKYGMYFRFQFATRSSENKQLLETIIKQTILVCFESIFTVFEVIWIVCIYTEWIVIYQDGNIVYNITMGIIVFILGFFIILPPLCIWLSFIFAQREYFLFCRNCYHCCFNILRKHAIKRLEIKNNLKNPLIEKNEEYELTNVK